MKSFNIDKISNRKVLWLVVKSMTAITLWLILYSRPLAASALNAYQDIDTAIFLREARELQELLVTPTNEKYKSKNNPAVDLVRSIRQNQKAGDPRLQSNYNYDQYDKITLGLLDIDEEDLKNYASLQIYLDTTAYGRRQMLKVHLNEKISTNLFSNGGKAHKIAVREKQSHGISEMFDVGNVDVVLEDLLREVNIYDNDITLLSNKFPSPLSSLGNMHYQYFIADTLDVDGMRCIQLTFMPRNPTDFSFSGNLYVEMGDTTGFIKKVSLKVPRTVNLNFIDNLYIDQIYEKDSLGYRHKISDKLNLDFCLVKGSQRFTASRDSRYDNFSNMFRDDLSQIYNSMGNYIEIGNPDAKGTQLLSYMRKDSLTNAESNMDSFMAHLREYPLFYWGEKVLVILVKGYVKTGKESKFDFGPINTFVSTNPIEGVRLRVGGTTTAYLSPHWFANGYIAYGTRDRKMKYMGELEYSFHKKNYHSQEFPINSLRIKHQYDMDMIGQHYHFTNPDNVFLSLKRKTDKMITYRHLTQFSYQLELANNLSFSIQGEHIKQDASPWLPFIDGYGHHIPYYRRTSIGVAVRYAPGEKFIQERESRVSVNHDAPIFQLSQEWGPKGIRGCHYSVCKTEASVWKRFWFSSFGYLDALAKGGILWTQVPFPELLWPNANLSYTIQPESYSLMNPMEFAMDRYASCDLTYWGNGVLFNKLPIIKRLGLREVVDFKCLWGTLSKRNNPSYHRNLYRFPTDAHAQIMGATPYMEISAGIDNIFKILRIDYVWRLTYRNIPDTYRSGIRVALHFKF